MPSGADAAVRLHTNAVPSRPAVLLGFDYGERRTGVAVGQTLTGGAAPLTTLRGPQPDWPAIEALIREWRHCALVVGRPAPVAGEDRLGARIDAFCRKLRGRFGLPVHTVDEAYSSTEARARLQTLRAQGRRRKTVKGDVDQMAAALLLEVWMNTDGGAGDAH